jgi:hypothetical protein
MRKQSARCGESHLRVSVSQHGLKELTGATLPRPVFDKLFARGSLVARAVRILFAKRDPEVERSLAETDP